MPRIAEVIMNDSLTVADWDYDPSVGTGASLFSPTVPADDGCIDSPVDQGGFLTHC